jgi:hypothetical protein
VSSSLSPFDDAVAQLMALGYSREVAEARVRAQLPQLAPVVPALDEDALEDDHTDAGDDLMRALGFTVIRLSQKRVSKITPGVPDRRYYHPRRRLVLWWEAKSATGRQRPGQRSFQELCDAVGDPYVFGTLDALKQHLITAGVVESFDERGLPHPTPIPKPQEQ